nr:hypothetical protein [Streptomyces sp. ISL-44]
MLAGQTPVLVHNSNCPLTGGFKVGVSPDEIADINRGFGGETLLSGSPANTLANASRYNSFWDKSTVVIRGVREATCSTTEISELFRLPLSG